MSESDTLQAFHKTKFYSLEVAPHRQWNGMVYSNQIDSDFHLLCEKSFHSIVQSFQGQEIALFTTITE